MQFSARILQLKINSDIMITHYFQMINMALDAYIYAYCLMTSSKPKKYEFP